MQAWNSELLILASLCGFGIAALCTALFLGMSSKTVGNAQKQTNAQPDPNPPPAAAERSPGAKPAASSQTTGGSPTTETETSYDFLDPDCWRNYGKIARAYFGKLSGQFRNFFRQCLRAVVTIPKALNGISRWMAQLSLGSKIFLLIWIGSAVLFYAIGIIFDAMQLSVTQLAELAKDANLFVTIILGLLGLVMTMVTIGVISISQKAVSDIASQIEKNEDFVSKAKADIRNYKQKISTQIKQHQTSVNKSRKTIKSYSKDIERGHLEIMIVQTNLFLIFENEHELEKEDDKDIKKARRILKTIYRGGFHDDFLEHLHDNCKPAIRARMLRPREWRYIDQLEKYYQRGAGSKTADASKLLCLARSLKNTRKRDP